MNEETTWDQRKFDELLTLYARWSKRTHKQIVDTKAYYIARKAVWFTVKADSFTMKSQLGGFIMVSRLTKKGKTVRHRDLQLVMGTKVNAPLAALIINKRRGRSGYPGLYGRDMARAVRNLLAARFRSIAFLKSGWIPAIQILAPLADKQGQPPIDPAGKQIGLPKGDAVPGIEGEVTSAEIWNTAGSARHDIHGALAHYGGEGLRIAMADEEASTAEYVERKMMEDARRFNEAQQ